MSSFSGLVNSFRAGRPGSAISSRSSTGSYIQNSRPSTSSSTGSNGHPGTNTNSYNRPNTSTTRPRTRGGRSTVGGHQEVICGLTESRGVSATVGLCFVDITTGYCVLSEICDSQTYVHTMHKIEVYNPTEILIPSTSHMPRKSTLAKILEEEFYDTRITALPRKYYNEQTGHDYVQDLCLAEDLAGLKVAISAKYYAISAVAAVMKHVELEYTKFTPHALRITYQSMEGSMLIDFSTVHSMELIQNLQSPKSKDCLFGLLNNTQSAMGSRLLRLSLLQPSTDLSVINTRLDAVEEFTKHEQMFFQVKEALKGFPDMDRLCTALITSPVKKNLKFSEQSINNVIVLKEACRCIPPVYEALASARCDMFVKIKESCNPVGVEPILKLIDDVINENMTFSMKPLDLRNQRCYAVKSGVNGLLDVARVTYKELTEDVHTYLEALTKEYEIQLELRFESGRGYFFRVPFADIEDRLLPEVFVNVVKRKKFLEFSTLELTMRNAKIDTAMNEVLIMSDETVQKLIGDLGNEISNLFRVGDAVALLDMITSFANLCALQDYVRPEFTETLAIKSGRHPIREKIHNTYFVPNDVYASQQTRFQIITGCNMSGKSTYLRSIALMTIMAQIGSFVPAQYASFPITTQIFARVSMDDSIEANVSTFASEMREAAFILQNVKERSLIIVDELGRGTSPRDGLAIALAVSEALIESRALVWFATHFRELAEILAERPGVINMHMQVKNERDTMTMLYRVANGSVKDEHYGLSLARVVGLPRTLLSRSEVVAKALAERQEEAKKSSQSYHIMKRRKLILKLKETLVQARDGRMEEEALKAWLQRVHEDFIEKMAALQEDHEDTEDGQDITDLPSGDVNIEDTASTVRGSITISTKTISEMDEDEEMMDENDDDLYTDS
ncbi:muts domain V-domain-containing protein [Geopyxis carbonaria]|nr:muts domain V-domain-containing protein [Geopyxis carbonaria]